MRAAQGKEGVTGTRTCVCTERENKLKSNAERIKSFVGIFQPWALKRSLRREGSKKSSIS